MQPGVLDLLRDLRRALRPLHVRWYVFGAQAVIFYGVPRLSDDVDVTVELAGLPAEKLVAALQRAGFKLQIDQDAEEFVRQTRVMPFTHLRSGVDLDLVLAGPGLEEAFLDRATELKVGRVRIPIVSVEDLIVLKVLAGRGKDLDDVKGVLLRKADQVDRVAVRRRLRELETILDRSDLISELDRAAPSGWKRRRRR